MMKAFLTGSQAYGTPDDTSDIDLVVFMDDDAAVQVLREASEEPGSCGTERFGKLNLVVLTDPREYKVWQRVTRELIARRPVSRDRAIWEIQQAQRAAGLPVTAELTAEPST